MRAIIIISIIALAAISAASAYNDTQNAMIQGARLSWDLANAQGDAAKFNGIADQWNEWVRTWFGEDVNLIVAKKPVELDLTKPILIANNTTSKGIVHEIDGMNQANASYTTNDMNLLPENAIKSLDEPGAFLPAP